MIAAHAASGVVANAMRLARAMQAQVRFQSVAGGAMNVAPRCPTLT